MLRFALALCGLVALAVARGAAAQSYIVGAPQSRAVQPLQSGPAAPAAGQQRGACDMGLTFFHPSGDNMPTGWSQAVQQAAGNNQPDQLMKIALAGYPIPQLYMAPVSVYTQVGGSVPVACVTGQSAAGAGVLTRPAAYTITWALAGRSGQLGPFLKGSKQDPPPNVTLNFVPELPDGDYCLQLKMDLIPNSGVVSLGAQQFEVPARAQSIMRQVCFYKLASRPSANITFHSCNSSFAVDLTGITPKPQFSRPDTQLFSTVFHVWGKLNRTFDASPQAEGLQDYFGQYVKWSETGAPDHLQVFLDSPGLVNGYYNVWIEGSLSTGNPDLNSLFGLDQYDDGSAKFMGVSLRNISNRPVPIQTVLSKIANLAGPEVPVPAGASAPFTWDTQGYGEQYCYVDGQRISNVPDRVHCESPLNLRVADSGNHTLEVVLLDVCGQTTANGVFFGSWGWRPNPKFQPAPPPALPAEAEGAAGGALPLPLARPIERRDRSGAATWRGAVAAAAAATAGAAALLLL
ncbi:hypothetical protein Rsub_01677 [Raphidocelis subcapitata]|uniref:Ig-like domain-containing protein n=1 Tax=Raphidocelis subcapitata TaxID=307507 RepID=A0A2V0NMN9_9CHLO|nr:hypothetical protein Rsub_01677 [Raphidocelis subcapitata]|eukprot:GBF88776.1 hypothetical protein Rsub_01677 [Raphidocelis subcapitata]